MPRALPRFVKAREAAQAVTAAQRGADHRPQPVPRPARALMPAADAYWYTGRPAAPMKLPKALGMVDPSFFSVAENVDK